MDKATKLLSRLDETIQCTHLDMGGYDRYSLTPRSYPIIKEIKLYLAEVDRHLTTRSSRAADACARCGDSFNKHCRIDHPCPSYKPPPA